MAQSTSRMFYQLSTSTQTWKTWSVHVARDCFAALSNSFANVHHALRGKGWRKTPKIWPFYKSHRCTRVLPAESEGQRKVWDMVTAGWLLTAVLFWLRLRTTVKQRFDHALSGLFGVSCVTVIYSAPSLQKSMLFSDQTLKGPRNV